LFIIVPVSQAALVNAIHKNAIENGCGFREAFRIGWEKYLNVFLCFILLSVIILVVLSLLVIPMVLAVGLGATGIGILCLLIFVIGPPILALFLYILILFSLYAQCVVIEDLRPIEALTRSARLIRGNWWRALGIFIALQLIMSFIYETSKIAFTALDSVILSFNQDLEILGHATIATGLTVVQISSTPILILGVTILFYDLKVRREAYDLEMMIRAF
jgi:hypothetical protein